MKIANPSAESIPLLRDLWKEAFGDDDAFLDNFFSTAFSSDRSLWIADGGKAAAMLYWFDCEWKGRKIAYIYDVATAVSHRGQGLCTRLMSHTHEHLEKLGYSGALLVPGSDSLFRFYEKPGYRTCCFKKDFSCRAGDEGLSLTKIGKEEYAQLRRRFIPENGVIQEKENLSFLETQAEFYKSENLLMCGYIEDGDFVGPEYLGNEALTAGALYALGCEKGSFSAPGSDVPFGMYLPFDNTDSYPSYFGLAFN